MDEDLLSQSPPALTEREYDVLRLLANGLSDREIAETLILSVGTVKWYNRQIYNKLGVNNRTEAVTHAQRYGLLAAARPDPPSVQQTASIPPDLPAQVTSFIGRKHELAELKASIKTTRLITLTGPPGAGKTRLALQAVTEIKAHFHDGVYFVPLGAIRNPDHVIQSVASVLGGRESGHDSLLTSLNNFLRHKHLLLLLDNFEHLLPAAPLVSELLAAASRLHVLVTSRERLRLYGEHEFPVPPLAVPDLKAPPLAEVVQSHEAVELFVKRSQAVLPAFALNNDNAHAVASICAHLDGLPLAIELAAARSKFYSPQSLLIRLSSRLEALSDGPRDLPSRQRTLRSTLAWSYDLLDEGEQILFARLGVFAGAWTLHDAQRVCGQGLNENIVAGIESLVNKSLVQHAQGIDEVPCFVLLETMREYALELLEVSGEKATIDELYVQHYLTLTNQAAHEMVGPDSASWFQQIEWQHDNLRAALRRCIETGNAAVSLQFVGGLARFWEVRGYLSEGLVWLTDTLALKGAEEPAAAQAIALNGGGDLAYLQSNYELAGRYYKEAHSIFEEIGDQKGAAHALLGLGEVATEVGDYETAPALFQQAYAIMHDLGDTRGSARACTQLGWGDLRVGNLDQAHDWLEKGLAQYQIADDRVGVALTYSGLGEVAVRKNELDLATSWLKKSLTLRRELDEKWGIAASLGSLAWVAIRRHNFDEAVELLEESLLIRLDLGDRGGMAWCLEKTGAIAYAKHELRRAVRILGAADSLRQSVNSVIDPSDHADYFALIYSLRNELGDNVFDALWDEGQQMEPEQAIRYVVTNDMK